MARFNIGGKKYPHKQKGSKQKGNKKQPIGYKNKSEEDKIQEQYDRNYDLLNHDEGFSEYDEDISLEGDLDLGDLVDEFDDRTQNRTYVETKWYEKTVNVLIASAVATALLAVIWGFGGDYILEFMGISQEYVENQDIVGRLDRYQNEVVDEVDRIINPEDAIEEEQRAGMQEGVEIPVVIGPGLYRVGQEIHAGQYFVQKGSKIKKYANEFDFVNEKAGEQHYGANTLDNLGEGMYIEILEGAITLNSDRPKTDVQINQTVVVESGNHYLVGVDLPAGYYKVVPQTYQKGVNVTINGALEGQAPEVDVARQTYVKLGEGNLLQVGSTALFTRVNMEFIY